MNEMSRGTNDRKGRYFAALENPTKEERPVVLLMEAAVLLFDQHQQNVVLREGVVRVLLALRVLLDGLPGDRLDRATIDYFIRHHMTAIQTRRNTAMGNNNVINMFSREPEPEEHEGSESFDIRDVLTDDLEQSVLDVQAEMETLWTAHSREEFVGIIRQIKTHVSEWPTNGE